MNLECILQAHGLLSKSKDKTRWFYKEGNEFINLTGGWVKGDSSGSGTQSKLADSLFLEVKDTPGNAVRTYVTANAIDLSNIDRLYIEWKSDICEGYLIFKVGNSVASVVIYKAFERRADILNVSNLTGEYPLAIQVYDNNTIVSQHTNLNVYRVWGDVK